MGTGAFHGGVEVYSREFSYGFMPRGTGVFDCPPTKCPGHTFWKSHPMGETNMSKAEIKDVLGQLRKEWKGAGYDLLRHNCCSFCDQLCTRLGVGRIPGWVTNLAAAGATLCDGVLAAASATQAAAIVACAMADKVDQRYRVGDAAANTEDNFVQNPKDVAPQDGGASWTSCLARQDADGGASWASCLARSPVRLGNPNKPGATDAVQDRPNTWWLAACFFGGRSADAEGDDDEETQGKWKLPEPTTPPERGDSMELISHS